MKKMLLAVAALASFATGANALTLTSAAVTGPTGTVWDTTQNGFYTLFLQNPGLGDFLNPNDEAISLAIANDDVTRALLAGEGFVPGTTGDSDPFYNLTLTFDDGQMLMGQYTPTTNTFLGGSSIFSGGQEFTLIEFSYRRFLGDAVQAYTATPGGDGNDYVGNFRISAAASVVPEPTTWAMLIVGFGLVGVAARRSKTVAKTYA